MTQLPKSTFALVLNDTSVKIRASSLMLKPEQYLLEPNYPYKNDYSNFFILEKTLSKTSGHKISFSKLSTAFLFGLVIG